MYKLSVPLVISTINEESLPVYLEEFQRAKVDRVFLCNDNSFYVKNNVLDVNPDKLENLIHFFKDNGFEVGVWNCSFGHGNVLYHCDPPEYKMDFTKVKGVDGMTASEAFCPLDENYQKLYYESTKKLAKMGPDIIMFDDDYRLNWKGLTMPCCCDKHLALFYQEIGEEIPMEKLEETIFTGGENKYRSAWLKVMGNSLLDFAKMLRRAVDEVDENIRLGACSSYSSWDFEGVDAITLAKAFAGKTKPFTRTIGAPYRSIRPHHKIEQTRMQTAWAKESGIEIFSEGDVYPRPRYAHPSRFLELFDLGLLATGETDGILKYMYDYAFDVNYEMGYNERHVRNEGKRKAVTDFFQDKGMVGVQVFEAMQKTEQYQLPDEHEPGVAEKVKKTFFSNAQILLSNLAIPTSYVKNTGYPVIVFGESARHIPEENLKNGAILDIIAARILNERGIDTGLMESKPEQFIAEVFPKEKDRIITITSMLKHRAEISPKAEVCSTFTPGDVPATYRYENEKGQRFFVLASNIAESTLDFTNRNYYLSYYRQNQLMDAVEWLCGKPLPAICKKHPFLYSQAAKGKDGAMTIALYNMHFDEIFTPTITLDKEYSSIRFLNCDGVLEGNTVTLSKDIQAYDYAIFEVK